MDKKIEKLPTASAGDVIHTGIKASLSAIPAFGGPGSELFTNIITPLTYSLKAGPGKMVDLFNFE